MKLAEFANNYRVSERHVRRLIQKYESDMVGHYEKRGNEGTFIDNVGVEFLKSKLRTQVDVVVGGSSERERQLENTITELSMRYAAACEKLVENAGAVALLEAAKEKELALEARADRAEERALEAEKKAEEASRQAVAATQKKLETELALEEANERAAAAEDVAELNAQEAERAKAEAEDLRAMLEQIAASRGLKRRKLLKELKRKEKES